MPNRATKKTTIERLQALSTALTASMTDNLTDDAARLLDKRLPKKITANDLHQFQESLPEVYAGPNLLQRKRKRCIPELPALPKSIIPAYARRIHPNLSPTKTFAIYGTPFPSIPLLTDPLDTAIDHSNIEMIKVLLARLPSTNDIKTIQPPFLRKELMTDLLELLTALLEKAIRSNQAATVGMLLDKTPKESLEPHRFRALKAALRGAYEHKTKHNAKETCGEVLQKLTKWHKTTVLGHEPELLSSFDTEENNPETATIRAAITKHLDKLKEKDITPLNDEQMLLLNNFLEHHKQAEASNSNTSNMQSYLEHLTAQYPRLFFGKNQSPVSTNIAETPDFNVYEKHHITRALPAGVAGAGIAAAVMFAVHADAISSLTFGQHFSHELTAALIIMAAFLTVAAIVYAAHKKSASKIMKHAPKLTKDHASIIAGLSTAANCLAEDPTSKQKWGKRSGFFGTGKTKLQESKERYFNQIPQKIA